MSYTPGATEGSAVSGETLEGEASGMTGWLSAIRVSIDQLRYEMKQSNELLLQLLLAIVNRKDG